jgi:hypothetical protein
MNKRITRKLSEVVADVRIALEAEFKITQEVLDSYRARVDGNGHSFPTGSHMIDIADLWIDYEVQRDVIPKHVIAIMKAYDPRLCGPASACRIAPSIFCKLMMDKGYDPTPSKKHAVDPKKVFTYDGQHRTVATALLGYTQVPCNIVITDDPAFPSYAFEQLNETGVKKLTPGDLHRNALTRFKLGSTEEKNVRARTLQDQFDNAGVDLEDKGTRKSATLRGNKDYYFSHFKYAYKGIELDKSGKTLYDILDAIRGIFPLQEEIDQGVYIGLYELARLDSRQELPEGWMRNVLKSAKKVFNSSATVHSKAKLQFAHVNPGASWSAPSAMANFLRELHLMDSTPGFPQIDLPYHGEGALMQVATNPANGLFPKEV